MTGGKLPGDVATMLRDKLAAFVRNPQVSVLVRDAVSKRVSVYGQVQHPGTFPYTGAMTIVQAISLAGGFTQMAARERVRVSHVRGDTQQVTEVNLRDIADGRSQNQFVAPGDPTKLTPPSPCIPSFNWAMPAISIFQFDDASISTPRWLYQAHGRAINTKPMPPSPNSCWNKARASAVIRSAVVGESP